MSVVLALPEPDAVAADRGQAVPASPEYAIAWSADFAAQAPMFLAASAGAVVTAGPAVDIAVRRPDDGSLTWSVPGSTATVPPVIGDGLVFLVADRALTARDEQTGEAAWSVTLAAPATHAPAWQAGALVVPTTAGLEAYRTNGTPVWRLDLAGIVATPVLGSGAIFVGLDAPAVAAITLADGREQWRRALPGQPHGLVALAESLVVSTADAGWQVYRLDGERRWAYGPRAGAIGAATADDDLIYLAMLDNTLQAFDRRSGNRRWVAALDERPVLGPSRAGDELVVAGGDGDLLAVSTGSARRVRRIFEVGAGLTGAAFEAFAAGPDAVYVIVSGQEAPGFRLHAVVRGAAGG